jgi:hypothetical protein
MYGAVCQVVSHLINVFASATEQIACCVHDMYKGRKCDALQIVSSEPLVSLVLYVTLT